MYQCTLPLLTSESSFYLPLFFNLALLVAKDLSYRPCMHLFPWAYLHSWCQAVVVHQSPIPSGSQLPPPESAATPGKRGPKSWGHFSRPFLPQILAWYFFPTFQLSDTLKQMYFSLCYFFWLSSFPPTLMICETHVRFYYICGSFSGFSIWLICLLLLYQYKVIKSLVLS